MALGVDEIRLIIDRQFDVSIPVDGLDVELFRVDFNLLTTDFTARRLIYKTQQFQVPLADNQIILDSIKKGNNSAQLFVNGLLILSGYAIEYGLDDLRKYLTLGLVSEAKNFVDFLGDNTLYLDIYDFSSDNFFVPSFSDANSTDLLKFAQYKPIDKTTGDVAYSQANLDLYCQPSVNLVQFFKNLFAQIGWRANWEIFSAPPFVGAKITLDNVLWVPTGRYLVSSFGGETPSQTLTIPAGGAINIPFSESWNIGGTSAIFNGDNTITVRSPARLMQFKLLGSVFSDNPCTFSLTDGVEELLTFDAQGNTTIRQYSSWVDPQEEGLDPIYLQATNDTSVPVTLVVNNLRLYNLVSAYENDQYLYLQPQGYYYPVGDNYPDVTPLDLLRQFMSQYQVAFNIEEQQKNINFYYINNIAFGDYGSVFLDDKLLWDGYVSASDELEGSGLARFNTIKYKDAQRRQSFFKIELDNLPASSVYFESFFGATNDDKNWQAMCVPNLELKVKLISDIPVSYLNFKETNPVLGYYSPLSAGVAAAQSEPLNIGNTVRDFWLNILNFLSSKNAESPTMFKIQLRVGLYDFLNNYTQNKLYYYKGYPSLLMDGSYNVLTQIFTGTFLTRR